MRNRLAMTVAFLLMVSACGGGSGATSTTASTAATTTTTAPTTTTTEPGFEVTSEDGDLTVEVPFEAMAVDPGISIRRLEGAEYPAEFAFAADNPDVQIYNLEPEGTVFAAPVTVTRRIDTSRFADLGSDDVPIILLVTYNEGAPVLFDDLRVVRNGDDIFVSGTTTHFSPVIGIATPQKVRLELDAYHYGYSTELGTSLDIGYRYYTMDGATELSAPALYEPVGYTRSIALGFNAAATSLGVNCIKIGDANPRLGVKVTLDAEAAAGQVGLIGGTTELIPGLDDVEVSVKLVVEFKCLDPETSFLGLNLTGLQFVTDHIGPGSSGSNISLNENPRLDGAWGGLILDSNFNGMLDATDTMFRPYPFMTTGGISSYFATFNTYGDYFYYVIKGGQYSAVPEGASWPVSAGLTAFQMNYTGSGRFESSIGFAGVDGLPCVYTVDASEGTPFIPVDPVIEPFGRVRHSF